MANPLENYIIAGRVLDDDNSTPRANISLSMKNLSTGEVIYTTTDNNGYFAFDCANYETFGYSDLDYVLVSTDSTGSNGQDLRVRIVSFSYGQVNQLDVQYSIRT